MEGVVDFNTREWDVCDCQVCRDKTKTIGKKMLIYFDLSKIYALRIEIFRIYVSSEVYIWRGLLTFNKISFNVLRCFLLPDNWSLITIFLCVAVYLLVPCELKNRNWRKYSTRYRRTRKPKNRQNKIMIIRIAKLKSLCVSTKSILSEFLSFSGLNLP